MAVQTGRGQIAGGFVGGGFTTRDYLFLSSQAPRALRALVPRTTPARIRSGLVAVVMLGCCLAGAVMAVSAGLDDDFRAMGQRAAPEVNATTSLNLALNDMDAQVANVLLADGDSVLAADRSRALAAYASDRASADADLQQAAVTAAGSPAAQRELRTVLDGMGQYQALAAQAILADQQAARTAGQAPAAALAYYRQATDLMQKGILPQVASLTAGNAAALDSGYQAGLSAAGTGTAVAAGSGAALLVALVAFQVYLAVRFRRLVNPALVAATLLALTLTGFGVGLFASEAEHLRVAKQDAFDSIIALTQARAISYDANADESRYLTDPGRAARYQQEFLADSQQVAAVGNVAIGTYDAALASDIAAYQAGDRSVSFGGYLGAEFRNITFPGERAAAVRTLLAYQVYERYDRRLRALDRTSASAAAAFDTGVGPGQSDWAFGQYTADLSALIAINENAFTAAVAAGEHGAAWQDADPGGGLPAGVIPVGALLLAGLGFLGVRPRLAEYHPETRRVSGKWRRVSGT
jgi:hypothetical protein